MIKVSDIDCDRIKRNPDKSIVLLTNVKIENQGYIIEHIEIRQYVEKSDPKLGSYSLLTIFIKTNNDIIEMKYDEGFRGNDALDSIVTMLTQYVGLSALINRALIELQRF